MATTPLEKLQAELVIREATLDDIGTMHALVNETAAVTTVLPRTLDSLCKNLRDFRVAALGPHLVGCGALHLFSPELAEVKTLVVDPARRGHGIGPRLVEALLVEARRVGVRRVFALTDNVPFFVRAGFTPVDKETLPQKVWAECLLCPKLMHCEEEAVDLLIEP